MAVRLRVARLCFVGLAIVALIVYFGIPLAKPVGAGLLGVASVGAIGAGVGIFRPQRWAGWMLLATAVALLTAGAVVSTAMAMMTPWATVHPGPPDVLYVLVYLPMAVGLLVLGRPVLPSRDWPMLLDTAALSLAVSLVVWIVLVGPAVTARHVTGPNVYAVIAAWVGYVAVVAAAFRVFIAWRTNVSLALLALAVSWLLVADFLYGTRVLSGWATNPLIEPGVVAFGLLCGASALTRSMARAASPLPARHRLGPLRLGILAMIILAAPTILFVEATSGAVTTGAAIAVVAAAVGVLMLVRLYLTAKAYRRRVRREEAVRVASHRMLAADTEDQVGDVVARAVATMVPAGAVSTVRLLDHAGVRTSSARAQLAGVDAMVLPLAADAGTSAGAEPCRPGSTRTDRLRAWGRPALLVRAPMVDLAELTPVLLALADQASSVMQRITLSATLQAEGRERYFRTLVLTSDDVTLISRDGVITYATPSAKAMFGRDVNGRTVDDLIVRQHAPPQWWTTTTGAEAHVPTSGHELAVWVRSRDLCADPTVAGVVTTLRDITKERRLQADLAYRASHDRLTGLANAQGFSDQLTTDDTASPAVERRGERKHGRAALFIDLDDFKIVNDTYGHRVGDQLLTEVAGRITACLRTDDLAARLGGDEFAAVLRNIADLGAAHEIAQRIADALATPATLGDIIVDCQASIGVAYAAGPGDTDTLLRQADIALYNAKAAGKGHWRQYHDGMVAPTRQHIEDRHRLEEALRDGRLSVYYQPIVDLHTADPIGFEALIRLSDEPPMTPDEVIAVAEDTGLIATLGVWILDQALAALPVLNPPGISKPRYVSVNVSARQVRQPDFVETVRRRIADTDADPALLVLEVTENMLVGGDTDRAWTFLADLRRHGVRIALDDYGTGYASLGYLRQPVFDIVKTDRTFLIDPGPRNLILLQAVHGVCERLNLDLVVEGVENVAGLNLATAAGAQHGQGFHYTPALPLEAAATWHRHRHDHAVRRPST
jgi:diguanylate cyclase (GGDEF)-like protein